MLGNNTYWWAGWLIFLLFATLSTIIFMLRNKPKLSYAIAWTIAAYLLVYKIGELFFWQYLGHNYKFPEEFSALSYYAFGIIVTFRLHKVESFPIFAALLSGLIYSIVFWFTPDSYVSDMETPYLFTMAIVNHHALYFGAMLLTANVYRFEMRYIGQQIIGIGLFVGYAWFIYYFTDYSTVIGKPIIIQISDSSILGWLFHMQSLQAWHKIVYNIFLYSVISFLLAGFYMLNHKMANRRTRKGLPTSYLPSH